MKEKYLFLMGIFLPLLSIANSLIPPAPIVNASSYILIDATTNKVILEYQADEKNPPASLTKIMTSYLVEKQIERGVVALSDQVPISVKAWRAEGSKMFVREGTKVLLSRYVLFQKAGPHPYSRRRPMQTRRNGSW